MSSQMEKPGALIVAEGANPESVVLFMMVEISLRVSGYSVSLK